MRVNRIISNLRLADLGCAKSFSSDFLGLSTVEFSMGWVGRCTSPETSANIQLVTQDVTSAEDSVVSVLTDDVDSVYAQAQHLRF